MSGCELSELLEESLLDVSEALELSSLLEVSAALELSAFEESADESAAELSADD